jgi:transposase
MIPLPSGVHVWLATGHTDMRKGFDGLALLVQETLRRNPHNGHLFVFRGRRGSLIKVLWHDGQGMCLYAKRLERGRFVWPSTVPREGADRTVTISARRDRLAAATADAFALGASCKRKSYAAS